MMRAALPPLMDVVEEVLPEDLRAELDLPDIGAALQMLHFPEDESQWQLARRRFKLQELLVLQLAICFQRSQRIAQDDAPECEPSGKIHSRILNRIGLELTSDQLKAIDEIGHDMSQSIPMNRLLQGDVGSGKTIVAVYAMMLAVGNAHQAVMMAPTEVLARQHYQTLSRILAESRVNIVMLSGSLPSGERKETLAKVANGEIDLLVGTQALLFGVEFKNLGLCVIDEQHRFGVRQRVTLRSGGIDPHYLVMSATPIPRSVAMTVFGDVELSTLREKPPGRAQVKTYLGRPEWRERWWTFVEQQLKEGRQAFVVAPRVDAASSSDDESNEDVSSVESVYEELRQGVFRNRNVALLHGRLPNDEKQRIMSAFSDGEIDVLVSTTVIEVGIDVPNATVMTILGAQRFGLAQLHQLRGRVSRGGHTGHVCVFTDGQQAPEEFERLQVFENTDDGFELAEADFRLRGPGDVLGSKQSGLPPLRIADVLRDTEILQVAREIAQSLIDEDPDLSAPQWEPLKKQLLRRYGKRLELGDVA